jgi:hypothetical protein
VWRLARYKLRVGWLAWHRAVHRHTVTVYTRHGGAGGELVLQGLPRVSSVLWGHQVRLRIALRISTRVAIPYRGHGGDVGVGVAGGKLTCVHHSLNLCLALVLEIIELFVSVEIIVIVNCVPTLILLIFIPLCFCQEFVKADHVILISIGLLENMLSHSFHFLFTFFHVILRSIRVVSLVKFFLEQNSDFIVIPLSISIKIVHSKECFRIPILLVHMILFLPDLF